MTHDRADETPLGWLLKAQIRESGPMPVSAFMTACLQHPQFGYYVRRQAIGAAGDFITAPEISQAFGELIGVWCAAVWQQMGAPPHVHLVELGPGRGTLMADALRSVRLMPAFHRALSIHLVDSNATLVNEQQQRLAAEGSIRWHRTLPETFSDGPVIVIANEFFDALPVDQFIWRNGSWRQRIVTLNALGELVFDEGGAVPFSWPGSAEDGDVREVCLVLDDLISRFGQLGWNRDFACLIIDYGSASDQPGDSLQAVQRHQYVSPFAAPGEADLTTHVNFAQLARTARSHGLQVDGPTTQAEFLGSLGIIQRVSRLMAANPRKAAMLESGVARLLAPNGMGSRFKAIGLRGTSVPVLPGLTGP